jgi:hypothetical protein
MPGYPVFAEQPAAPVGSGPWLERLPSLTSVNIEIHREWWRS